MFLKDDLINSAWLSFYSPKKITKRCYKAMDIAEIITAIKKENFRFLIISKLASGVVNIYYNKFRILYDEFISITSLPQNRKPKEIKTHPITKREIHNEIKEPFVIPNNNSVLLPTEIINDNSEMIPHSFENEINYSVDLINDNSSFLRNTTLNKSNKSELDEEINVKRVKKARNNKKEEVIYYVNELFNDFLKSNTVKEDLSLEIERASSVLMDNYDSINYDFNNDIIYNENHSLFSISNLPDEFIFDEIIDSFEKSEKAKSFMKLIELANKNLILITQNELFGEIKCKIINN